MSRDAGESLFSRQERFTTVGSTNDVVQGWLVEGVPEICLAVADAQTAGRGRSGRRWVAPPGAALLASLGFRPAWLAPERAWRLAGTVGLAMADAAEEVAGLKDGTIRLKWPNDLVHETDDGVRKLAGVLGETSGLGTDDPRAVIGIGVNADWAAVDFPPELAPTMTSLREASGGRPVDLSHLLDAFTSRIETRIAALRDGWFDLATWMERQITTRRSVELIRSDGRAETVLALGLDARTGALVVEDADGVERHVTTGEIRHARVPVGATARDGVV